MENNPNDLLCSVAVCSPTLAGCGNFKSGEDLKRRFGLALKRWRSRAEISQKELARRAGLNRTYVAGRGRVSDESFRPVEGERTYNTPTNTGVFSFQVRIRLAAFLLLFLLWVSK